MKKIIVHNNENIYHAKYIISRKKYVHYNYKKYDNSKLLVFYKDDRPHRICNLGPQFKDKYSIKYRENGKLHNLYGYAYISKTNNIYQYCIYGISYRKYQFKQYINILNKLSYKRTYL